MQSSQGRHKSEPVVSFVGTDSAVVTTRYELPTDLLRRYHALLDEKFTSGLNGDQTAELVHLGALLDVADLATPLEQEAAAQARRERLTMQLGLQDQITTVLRLIELVHERGATEAEQQAIRQILSLIQILQIQMSDTIPLP